MDIEPPTATINGDRRPPVALTDLDSWLTYRIEQKPDGKLNKIPTDPDTGRDKDRADFGMTYEQALQAAADSTHVSDIGLYLKPGYILTCIDLDGCRDPKTGRVEDWAMQIVRLFDSYAEVSISGKGIHVFVTGVSQGRKRSQQIGGHKVEIYSYGQFIAVTGDHLAGTPDDIRPRQDILHKIAEAQPAAPVRNGYQGEGNALDDEAVLDKARNGKNADLFIRLYDYGDLTAHAADHSRADAGLVGILGFWTNYDRDQTIRLWQRSAISRGKTYRADYIRRTIDFAFSGKDQDDGYQPDGTGDVFISGQPISYTPGSEPKYKNILGQTPGGRDRSLNPNTKLRVFSLAELEDEFGADPDYVLPPIVARGGVTDLSGPAKHAGKTTFLLHAVAAILDGKPFLGKATKQTRVVYLTEQAQTFLKDAQKAGIDREHPGLYILPRSIVAGTPWPDLIQYVREVAKEQEAGLVIIDTLNRFAGLTGEQENQAGHAAAIMTPLLDAAQQDGLAVLQVRHANWEGKARGSTQFDHDVDQLVTLKKDSGGNECVRVLDSIGRYHSGTMKVELTPSGYVNLGNASAVKVTQVVDLIYSMVSTDPENPTRRTKILKRAKALNISESSVKRALQDMTDLVPTELSGEVGRPVAYYRVSPDSLLFGSTAAA
jgi:hypothetical protein